MTHQERKDLSDSAVLKVVRKLAAAEGEAQPYGYLRVRIALKTIGFLAGLSAGPRRVIARLVADGRLDYLPGRRGRGCMGTFVVRQRDLDRRARRAA